MDTITEHIGQRIKMYRKVQGLTLEELASRIHKSRSTVSKYENGDIILDVETLYDISKQLHIHMNQLTDYHLEKSYAHTITPRHFHRHGPFYETKRLYFYFYDGRSRKIKDGIIDILDAQNEYDQYQTTLFLSSLTDTGRTSESFYQGDVLYSDILIRFSFINQLNPLEEDLLYIFNPLERREYTEGLLCGISSADYKPCSFKCLVALSPQIINDSFIKKLMIDSKDLKKWKKLNMMLIDNID
ncbi:helix-turn-helix domain-containing protein [Eggerthia catenaformis]|uniref:helix-turn-helix domain-containing protein n=1 Tax=Eggerthia catenaformis TaxID=31973 RepID=UPI0028E51691|nr:helix-turn-helix transcriptional regulator [Eggerthia catenaformis]